MKSNFLNGRVLLGILYIVIAVAIILAGTFVSRSKVPTEMNISLGGVEISVMIANTPALHERGLGGATKLNTNDGMLFVFPSPIRTGFWMKDMLFPIDVIWFDTNRRIVDVWENAQPSSYPEIHVPQKDAQYVLEVQSGFFKKHNLKLGDVLELESASGYTI